MAFSQGTGPACCHLAGRKLRDKHSGLTLFLPSDLLLLPFIGPIQLKAGGLGSLLMEASQVTFSGQSGAEKAGGPMKILRINLS